MYSAYPCNPLILPIYYHVEFTREFLQEFLNLEVMIEFLLNENISHSE